MQENKEVNLFISTIKDVFELYELVKCCICYDVLTNPVTIKCKHTFCEDCLKNVSTKTCPICRVAIGRRDRKPNKGAENLAKFVLSIADNVKKTTDVDIFADLSFMSVLKSHKSPEKTYKSITYKQTAPSKSTRQKSPMKEISSAKSDNAFDLLLNETSNSQYVVRKPQRTYHKAKAEQEIQDKLIPFEDNESRENILSWLKNSQNEFDRYTQTQQGPIEESIPDEPLFSISQAAKRRKMCENLNDMKKTSTKRKRRCKSLDIEVREKTGQNRLLRQTIGGSREIESIHKKNKARLPPEENIINTMEEECLKNLEEEFINKLDKTDNSINKSTSGWNRIHQLKKTIKKTERKPKKLKINTKKNKSKKNTSDAKKPEIKLLAQESFFLKHLEVPTENDAMSEYSLFQPEKQSPNVPTKTTNSTLSKASGKTSVEEIEFVCPEHAETPVPKMPEVESEMPPPPPPIIAETIKNTSAESDCDDIFMIPTQKISATVVESFKVSVQKMKESIMNNSLDINELKNCVKDLYEYLQSVDENDYGFDRHESDSLEALIKINSGQIKSVINKSLKETEDASVQTESNSELSDKSIQMSYEERGFHITSTDFFKTASLENADTQTTNVPCTNCKKNYYTRNDFGLTPGFENIDIDSILDEARQEESIPIPEILNNLEMLKEPESEDIAKCDKMSGIEVLETSQNEHANKTLTRQDLEDDVKEVADNLRMENIDLETAIDAVVSKLQLSKSLNTKDKSILQTGGSITSDINVTVEAKKGQEQCKRIRMPSPEPEEESAKIKRMKMSKFEPNISIDFDSQTQEPDLLCSNLMDCDEQVWQQVEKEINKSFHEVTTAQIHVNKETEKSHDVLEKCASKKAKMVKPSPTDILAQCEQYIDNNKAQIAPNEETRTKRVDTVVEESCIQVDNVIEEPRLGGNKESDDLFSSVLSKEQPHTDSLFYHPANKTLVHDKSITLDEILKVADEHLKKKDNISVLQNLTIQEHGKNTALNDSDDEMFHSDADIIEGTPERPKKKITPEKSGSSRKELFYDIPIEEFDSTIPPPPQFQDGGEKKLDPEVSKVTSQRVLQDIRNINSEQLLSLSPITKDAINKTLEMSMFQDQATKRLSSTPKSQKRQTTLNRFLPKKVEKGVELFGTQKNLAKPCIACTRLTKDQVIAISALTNKKLATYSTVFNSNVTHMVVSTNEHNYLKDHTIKFVSAVAAGIWVVNFSWVQDCLAHSKIMPEVQYEALDVSGLAGPRESRLHSKTNPLLKGFKIYAAPPFISTTEAEVESIVAMLGGQVASSLEDLRNKRNVICVIITETRSTQEFEDYEKWLETYKVLTVDIEWLSRSVGQYKLLNFRRFALCSDDSICDLGYPEHLVENVPYTPTQTTVS